MNAEENKQDIEQAIVYVRTARAGADATASVQRQSRECLAMAARLGFDTGSVAVLKDTSVPTSPGGARPGFRQLLDLVAQGQTRIVTWHIDQLTRSPRDLEALVDAAEARPLRIKTVTGGADFDLSTPEGRFLARLSISIASDEEATGASRPGDFEASQGSWTGEHHAR